MRKRMPPASSSTKADLRTNTTQLMSVFRNIWRGTLEELCNTTPTGFGRRDLACDGQTASRRQGPTQLTAQGSGSRLPRTRRVAARTDMGRACCCSEKAPWPVSERGGAASWHRTRRSHQTGDTLSWSRGCTASDPTSARDAADIQGEGRWHFLPRPSAVVRAKRLAHTAMAAGSPVRHLRRVRPGCSRRNSTQRARSDALWRS